MTACEPAVAPPGVPTPRPPLGSGPADRVPPAPRAGDGPGGLPAPTGPDGPGWPASEAPTLPMRVPAGEPVRAPRRTHRWGVGAYVIVEAVFLGASVLIGAALRGGGPSVGALTGALAVPTVLAAATAVLITRLRGNGPRIDLGWVWSWHDVRVGLAYGFGGLVITIPASLLYVVLVGPERASSSVGDVFAGLRAGPVAAVGVALVVVIIAPICEEIVYRGLLWGAIERYPVARWVPFVVTTLLFAVAHFELTRTPLLFIVALPIALARLRTGRLAASVVAHQVNNLLPGTLLALTLLGVVQI